MYQHENPEALVGRPKQIKLYAKCKQFSVFIAENVATSTRGNLSQ